VGPREDRFADRLGKVKATTLFDKLENVEAEDIVPKLTDTDRARSRTLGHILEDVKVGTLIHTLAHTSAEA